MAAEGPAVPPNAVPERTLSTEEQVAQLEAKVAKVDSELAHADRRLIRALSDSSPPAKTPAKLDLLSWRPAH